MKVVLNRIGILRLEEMVSVPPFWAWNCTINSKIFPNLTFVCEIKKINVFDHILLWEKQPPRTYLSISFFFSCWKCPENIALSKVGLLKKPHQQISFLVPFVVNCCEFMYISLINLSILWELFFQAALIGCLFKEKMLTGLALLLN